MARCLECKVATFNIETELCSIHDEELKNNIKDYIYEQRKKKTTVNKQDIIKHFKDTKPYLTTTFLNKYINYLEKNDVLMLEGDDVNSNSSRKNVSREELIKQLSEISNMYKEEKKQDSKLGSGMHYQGYKSKR